MDRLLTEQSRIQNVPNFPIVSLHRLFVTYPTVNRTADLVDSSLLFRRLRMDNERVAVEAGALRVA